MLPSPFQATRNLSFLEVLFQLDVHWSGTGWFECSTELKPYKQVRARGGGTWACLARAHLVVSTSRYIVRIRIDIFCSKLPVNFAI